MRYPRGVRRQWYERPRSMRGTPWERPDSHVQYLPRRVRAHGHRMVRRVWSYAGIRYYLPTLRRYVTWSRKLRRPDGRLIVQERFSLAGPHYREHTRRKWTAEPLEPYRGWWPPYRPVLSGRGYRLQPAELRWGAREIQARRRRTAGVTIGTR